MPDVVPDVPEPPKPGDRVVVLYRGDEAPYGMVAVLATVIDPAIIGKVDAVYFWFRLPTGNYMCRRLDEEGIEWARFTGNAHDFEMLGGWCDLVPGLLAARTLAESR